MTREGKADKALGQLEDKIGVVGTIDPLESSSTQREDLWYHLDKVRGGIFICKVRISEDQVFALVSKRSLSKEERIAWVQAFNAVVAAADLDERSNAG